MHPAAFRPDDDETEAALPAEEETCFQHGQDGETLRIAHHRLGNRLLGDFPKTFEDGDGLIDVVLKLGLRRNGAGNQEESAHEHSQRSLHDPCVQRSSLPWERIASIPHESDVPAMSTIDEYMNDLPTICGIEDRIATILEPSPRPAVFRGDSPVDLGRIRSACAIALHMHQALIPAGGTDLRTAAIISNLQHMMENPHIGDNHNAPVFVRCYKRMGEAVRQLLEEGAEPRVMLEYSGTLLHG